MRQLFTTLNLIHQKGIVHRDLKPDNILINGFDVTPAIYIADFGFSVRLSDLESRPIQIYGTPGYVCPEVLDGEPANEKSDIFSAGAILYYLITGRHLFKN